jgi:D-hydroxyproline dehydrogenase subunit beta
MAASTGGGTLPACRSGRHPAARRKFAAPPVTENFDLIIVGAGIVGAACAAACSRAGLSVLVVDRGCIGGGTTAAGMGHIVVMDDSEAQFALTSYSRRLWLELRPQLPDDVEYELCGTLWVAADEEEMNEVRRKEKYYRERGVTVEVLDSQGVKEFEPNLRPGLAGGLRVPEDGVLYPPCAARFLLSQARQSGAEIRTGIGVEDILVTGGVTLSDGSRASAGRVVNATGPWSPSLTPGVPVRKRKGHLVITDRHPGFVHHQIVELGYLKSAHSVNRDSVAFNIQPRKTGQMLIGSSRQFDANDTTVDQTILDRMLNRALVYLPGLGKLSATRVWTGHRAATPDKLPLIGPSLESDRVWLATGHEGLGITTSLGTGRLLADTLMQRPTEIPFEPYLPGRFAKGVPEHD